MHDPVMRIHKSDLDRLYAIAEAACARRTGRVPGKGVPIRLVQAVDDYLAATDSRTRQAGDG